MVFAQISTQQQKKTIDIEQLAKGYMEMAEINLHMANDWLNIENEAEYVLERFYYDREV